MENIGGISPNEIREMIARWGVQENVADDYFQEAVSYLQEQKKFLPKVLYQRFVDFCRRENRHKRASFDKLETFTIDYGFQQVDAKDEVEGILRFAQETDPYAYKMVLLLYKGLTRKEIAMVLDVGCMEVSRTIAHFAEKYRAKVKK